MSCKILTKGKNHMTILKDTEKVSENIQHLFMIQSLSKLEMEENFLILKKDLYGQPKNYSSRGNTELTSPL